MDFLGYGREYVFYTRLKNDECVKTMTDSIGIKHDFGDIRIKTKDSKFQLFKKRDSTSSYNPVFYGRLVDLGGETRVEGYFGLSVIEMVITIFLYLWLIVFPFLVMESESIVTRIMICCAIISFSALITVVNMLWGKQKMKPLLDFIKQNLNATWNQETQEQFG